EIARFRLHPLLRDLRLTLMPGCRQQPGASPIPFIAVRQLTYAFIFYDDHQWHSPHCFINTIYNSP
ncbi:hypothetical protein AIN29_16210, partial [Salmonella enterica subsp. enterica serovar Newport]